MLGLARPIACCQERVHRFQRQDPAPPDAIEIKKGKSGLVVWASGNCVGRVNFPIHWYPVLCFALKPSSAARVAQSRELSAAACVVRHMYFGHCNCAVPEKYPTAGD